MRTLRWFAATALAAAAAALVTPAAASPTAVPYQCVENGTAVGAPAIEATIGLEVTTSAGPVRVFQPVTWTLDLEEPDLLPPLAIALHYFRVRLPLPPGLSAVSARAIATPGETPNPTLSAVSVSVTADEVILQLPAAPATNRRIFAGTDGFLGYPYTEGSFFAPKTALVLPRLEVTGHPSTPAATVDWEAPVVETAATTVLGNPDYRCAPTATPTSVIASTAVGTAVQTCDGKAVTVQLGYNTPTAGNDVIQGTAGNDTVSALGGNDRFCGLDGNDTFRGGNGNDRARGGNGNDTLRGDAGTDNLAGEAGNDTLVGGPQRDVCAGSTGRDTATTCEVLTGIP